MEMHNPCRPPASPLLGVEPGGFGTRPPAVCFLALLSAVPSVFVVAVLVFVPDAMASIDFSGDNAAYLISSALQVAGLLIAGICLLRLRAMTTWIYGLVFALFSFRFVERMSGSTDASNASFFGTILIVLAALLGYSVYLQARGRLR